MCCLEALACDLRKSAQHITPLRAGHRQMEWRVGRRHSCFVEGLNVNVIRTIGVYVTGDADLTLHRYCRCGVADSCLIRTRTHILAEIDLVNPGAENMLHPYRCMNAALAHHSPDRPDHRPIVLACQRIDSILQRRKPPSH